MVMIWAVLGVIIWLLASRQSFAGHAPNRVKIGYDKLAASLSGIGAVVLTAALVMLAPLAVLGLAYMLISWFFVDTYSVSLDTPSKDVTLGEVEERYRGDTEVKVIITDRAKQFAVRGSFDGKCPKDLFDAICRKYSSHLSCNSSWWSRDMTIDLAKPK